MKQYQGPLLHFQCLVFVLRLPNFDSCAVRPSGSERRLQILKLWQPVVTLDQALSQRLRQVRPSGNAETSVLERGIFKRISERQCAEGIREADASVLVRDDLTTDTGDFDDELTLCDAQVAVT